MSSKVNITVDQDSTNGRLNKVSITRKGRKLEASYYYVGNGLSIDIKGNKLDVPSTADLLRMIDAKFIQKVEVPDYEIFNQAGGADDAVVWTPEPGKSFRLLGGLISFPVGAVTAASATAIYLWDGADFNNCIWSAILNGVAAAYTFTAPLIIPFTLPQNGYKSLAPDNILHVGLRVPITHVAANLTTGIFFTSVWGTEE